MSISAGPRQGIFSARITGALEPGKPLDPLDIGGGSVTRGSIFAGRFLVSDSGYAQLVGPAPGPGGLTWIYGNSDARPGLISVTLVFPDKTFVQSDSSFNQVTYEAKIPGLYDTQVINANNVGDTGLSTQTIMSLTISPPLTASSLAALVDQGFFAKLGSLTFYAFDNHVIIGGFVAEIIDAEYGFAV